MSRVSLYHKDLVRYFEAEAFSGTVVEAMCSPLNVVRREGLEAHFLWEELPDEAVPILVGAALAVKALHWTACKPTFYRPCIRSVALFGGAYGFFGLSALLDSVASTADCGAHLLRCGSAEVIA